MADKYWFLDETPPETPEMGGYSFGLIDGNNPAPEGAEVFPNKTQLNKSIKASEDAFTKAIDAKEKSNLGQDRKAEK